MGEIPFHAVGHDVGNAACRLIGRQGHHQFWIHDSKERTQDIAVSAAFVFMTIFRIKGDHGIRGSFGPGSGDGHNAAYRKGFRNRALLAAVKVPEISIIGDAQSNPFCRVHDGAAAYSENEVHFFFLGKIDAFVDEVSVRRCLDAAQFHVANALCIKGCFNTGNEAGTDSTSAAVVNKDFGAAVFFDVFACFFFRLFPKDKVGWTVKSKVIHVVTSYVFPLVRGLSCWLYYKKTDSFMMCLFSSFFC